MTSNVISVITNSGEDFSSYPTTLSYLQDVVEGPWGFKKFYKDVLFNQEELGHDDRIPESLQNAPPVRDLEMDMLADFTSDKVS